jgi:HlyD family secretion protein
MTKKTALSLGTAAVLAASLLGLSLAAGAKEAAKYRTAPVTRGDITSVVVTTGILNPVTLVDVGSEISGEVAKVNVDFNSRVEKGEVLAELDRKPFEDAVEQDQANLTVAQAAVDQAVTSLDIAKKAYDRTLDLFQKKLVSQEAKEADEEAYLSAQDDLKVARAGLDKARAELDSSRLDLSKTLIRSPIDGVVVTRNVEVGQTVTARFEAPVLFTLADDLKKMRLECDIDEAAVGRIREGEKVEFSVEAFPSEVFTGRVIQIRDDAEVDSDVVRYPAICEVDNVQVKLRPGMTATATIFTGEAKGVLRIPNAALRFVPPELTASMKAFIRKAGAGMPAGESPTIVWTLDSKGGLTPLSVKLGAAGPEETELLGGDLREGQAIVTGLASGK